MNMWKVNFWIFVSRGFRKRSTFETENSESSGNSYRNNFVKSDYF